MKKTLLCITLLAGLCSGAALGQTIADMNFETIPLSDNVSLVTSRAGGNLAVCFGPDGLLVIDSDYTELNDKLKTTLAELADDESYKAPRYIVNTHWHFDHTGGNASFADAGAVIVAHENVRTRLAAGQLITIINAEVPPAPEAALPTEFITDRRTFKLNGQQIECVHMPHAHTDGDVVVRFIEANVVHTGDLVFYPGYSFIDISSGGNVDGVIAGLTEVLSWCDPETQVIPGHGPLTDAAGLGEYIEMLKSFRAAVAAEIDAGHDLAEIQAGDATAAIDEKWDNVHFPSSMFREMVYLSLVKQ